MSAACATCGQPASRTLAADDLCSPCAEQILAPIRRRVTRRDRPATHAGVGEIIAPRSDWGSIWFDLECDVCGAGWTGRDGEACSYCAIRLDRTITDQHDLVLRPDVADPGDARRESALAAWVDRLAVAVAAGIVDEDEARRAVERHEVRDAAA